MRDTQPWLRRGPAVGFQNAWTRNYAMAGHGSEGRPRVHIPGVLPAAIQQLTDAQLADTVKAATPSVPQPVLLVLVRAPTLKRHRVHITSPLLARMFDHVGCDPAIVAVSESLTQWLWSQTTLMARVRYSRALVRWQRGVAGLTGGRLRLGQCRSGHRASARLCLRFWRRVTQCSCGGARNSFRSLTMATYRASDQPAATL